MIKLLISRANGRLAAIWSDGKLYEQVVDPADYRAERTIWAPIDTSSLPKHLGIVSVVDTPSQRLVVQLEDGSLWQQVRDPDVLHTVAYRFAPISLAGLPEEPKPKPQPQPARARRLAAGMH